MLQTAQTTIRYVPSTLSQLKKAAWREWRETLDVQGRLGEVMRATDYPPGGFIAEELGFGLLERPSLADTMRGLDRDRLSQLYKDSTVRPKRTDGRKNNEKMTGARAQQIAQALLRKASRR